MCLMLWSVIAAIAMTQHGLITRWQVLEAGGSDRWIQRCVQSGRLIRLRHGVYAIAGATSEHQALAAVCLSLGRMAAASHWAAVSHWGAEQVLPCLEVTTFDHYRRRLPDVRTHWSRLDPSVAITSYQNVPVVVAPLSVVQIARDGDRYLVERVANDLVRRNVTTFAEILEWIDTARDGPRTHLRALCVNALNVGGHFDSPTCRQLCLRLTMAGAAGFRIDFQVADAEGVLLIDIAWPASKVGIEYNGAQYHDNALARANDARRRNRLAAAGWTMLQADHTMSLDDVVRWALAALATAQRIA
ncbi:MAG: type IV toxin-antitoxin system AbiEi family antitoxin domain-containing protein [Acidimicrobiales bacterium]